MGGDVAGLQQHKPPGLADSGIPAQNDFREIKKAIHGGPPGCCSSQINHIITVRINKKNVAILTLICFKVLTLIL